MDHCCVFVDRICDGITDCHDGSDEDESRFECGKTMGCCDGYRLWDETDGFDNRNLLIEYEIAGEIDGRPSYNGLNSYTKQKSGGLFCIKNENGNNWFIAETENSHIVPKWMFGFKVVLSPYSCPPVGSIWSNGFMDRKVNLECFHKKRAVNYCNESSCDINAHCVNLLNTYKCECNYGFTGDGKFCSAIIEIDECATNEHDCSENAICVDQRYGYTCVCKKGFIDRNSANPGRTCKSLKPSNDCCSKFQMFYSPTNSPKNYSLLTCSIKEYSTFRFSPLRQSYICDIEKSTVTKYPNIGISALNLRYANFTRLYIEHNGDHWIIVDRDENMNLIRKYDIGSSTDSQRSNNTGYKDGLCVLPDLSADTLEPPAKKITYTKCLNPK